jgi:F-type H+-transporting ATPase subunit delta
MKKLTLKHLARAAHEFGQTAGIWEQFIVDLKSAALKIAENEEARKYLLDGRVTLADKKKALRLIFEDFISARTYNFIYLLIKSEKLEYFDEIIRLAEKQSYQAAELTEITVESVVPLTAEQNEAIEKIIGRQLQAKVFLRHYLKPELIGGLRLTIGDRVIDSSIAGKIIRLREVINHLA